MPQIRIINLTKKFEGGGGVEDINFDVADGEHFVIVGPSGSGKTTILRLIAGLESPAVGTIELDGKNVNHLRPDQRKIGYLGQRPALYPHLTVRRNLGFGVELRQFSWIRKSDTINSQELNLRIEETAQRLELTHLLDRSIDGLSGGEQQRIVLGRMIIVQHRLWLLDEPLAHLDPSTRDSIRWQLHLLRQSQSPTIIEVTHDPVDARTLGDRVAVLLDGQVAQVGTPAEVYARPTSRGVATSLGWPSMNFIAGSAAPDAGATEPFAFPGLLGVRPEDVGVGPPPVGAFGLGHWQLVQVETPGPLSLWTLSRGDARLRRWAGPMDQPSEMVQLHVLAGRAHWFDPMTGQRLNN